MRFSLLPTMITDQLTDLSVPFLQKNGIRLLMLDFDNTIIPYTTDEPTPQVLAWLQTVRDAGIKLCVVSNSYQSRVTDFCKKYGLECVTGACKPLPKGIRRCMEYFELTAEECAFVGDQIFTDTLGANNAGVRSILVKSIDNHNFWLKIRHVLEKPFIYFARKRRIQHEEH